MNDMTKAKDRLAADFREVMTDIESLMDATTNKAEGEVVELRARIRDRLEAAKHRFADAQHEAMQRARYAAQATDSFVHEHPWQAVGVAAAVGLAIGVLVARR